MFMRFLLHWKSRILIFLTASFFPLLVFAATPTPSTQEPLQAIAAFLAVVIRLLTFFTMMFLNYGGDLLGTEFLLGDRPIEAITSMWIVIRNIMNICFVAILLFLVFSNIFGMKGWSIKEKLPKVVISLVAINFSLVAFKALIDFVNVGTFTILSIPQTVLEDRERGSVKSILMQGVRNTPLSQTGSAKTSMDAQFCEKLDDPGGESIEVPDGSGGWKDGKIEIKDKEGNVSQTFTKFHTGQENCTPFYAKMNAVLCNRAKTEKEALDRDGCLFFINPAKINEIESNNYAAHNLMMAFGVYFYRLEQLPALAARLESWDGVVTSVLFSSVMALAIFTALVAMFIVLLVRIVVLWVMMVFSPVIMSLSIMGIGKIEWLSFGKVLKYMFIPLYMAGVFAVTFILTSAMIGFEPNEHPDFMTVGPSLSLFGYGMTGILWQIAVVAIFWTSSFNVLKGSGVDKFIGGMVGKIESMASGLGKAALNAATIDRPIFKVPSKDGGAPVDVSLRALGSLPQGIIQEQRRSGDAMVTNLQASLLGDDKLKKAFDDFNASLVGATGDVRKLATEFHNFGLQNKVQDINNSSGTLRQQLEDTMKREIEKTSLSSAEKDKLKGYADLIAKGQITESQWAEIVNTLDPTKNARAIDYMKNPTPVPTPNPNPNPQPISAPFTWNGVQYGVGTSQADFSQFLSALGSQKFDRSQLDALASAYNMSVRDVKSQIPNLSSIDKNISFKNNSFDFGNKKGVSKNDVVDWITANIDNVKDYSDKEWKIVFDELQKTKERLTIGTKTVTIGSDVKSVDELKNLFVDEGLLKK